MTVARDAVLEAATFTTTSPHDFTFTPSGTPRGIIVAVAHGTGSGDLITSITYGGVAMTRIDRAVDAAGEPGAAYLYFLGASIPTGAQTVSITHTATATVKWPICMSVTAADDTEIITKGKLEGDQADPQIALDTSAVSSLRFSILHHGAQLVTDVAILSGMETLVAGTSHDFGNTLGVFGQQTTAATGSFTIGYTALTDDVAMVAVAVQEIAGGAATVTPAVVASVAALATPAILAAATLAPAVIPIVASLPTPLIAAAATVTPAAIAVVTTLPTPTISVGAVVAPAAIAVVTTLPTPTISVGAVATPAVIAVTTTLLTPNVLAASKVLPAVIPVTVALPTPTIDVAGGPVVATPAVIPVVVNLPTPAVLAASKVVPAVIPLVVTLPTPTIVVASSATVLPATITVVAGLPTPTITAAVVVTPAGIALVVTVPTPSVTTPGLVTPAGISLVVTLPTPNAIVGAMTFWTPNPVAFVPVGPGDTPPWN